MKFTRKDRDAMRSMIADGTMVGPVTQELIDVAVTRYERACSRARQELEEFGWIDFIGPARKQLADEEQT